jgi:hypothetical protein
MSYLDWIIAVGVTSIIIFTGWTMYHKPYPPDANITIRVTPLPDGSFEVTDK